MTYLSRVEINPNRIETMKALSSPEIIHAAVMASFPSFEGENRPLWRIDQVGEATYLLVQSNLKPDFTHFVQQFGWPASGQRWDTLDYDKFVAGVLENVPYQFRIRANPVRSVSSEGNGRGKVRHHITAEQQLNWFVQKATRCGFSIEDEGLVTAKVVKRELVRFKSKGNSVSISAVTFEGVLKVTDKELFIQNLLAGIGRAKAYGCGLLSISE